MNEKKRRVATYERVSSEDQAERGTILTQSEELARRLAADPSVELVGRYIDNGVSGVVPLVRRPAGRRLLADAEAGRYEELWVYKLDRLGRDAIDRIWVSRRLDELGIRVMSVLEGQQDLFGHDLRAVIDDNDRRMFLRRSADGMNRAAREGRYCGGVVPLGYRVEGERHSARLVPDETPMWGDWTAAGLIRQIYGWLAVEGWSCRRVADQLNALGVPTAYQRVGRGVRGRRVQGVWRPGRIRNLVVNPVYKGLVQYGRRTRKQREVISAAVPALVSAEVWEAAQATLAHNRTMPKNTRRTYLLRSVIECGHCGLKFSGGKGREGVVWYRCNGYLAERGRIAGRCPSKTIKGESIEPVVWRDIERFLRSPGLLLQELEEEVAGTGAAVAEAERISLQRALDDLATERDRTLDLYRRAHIDACELERFLEDIASRRARVEQRLAELGPTSCPQEPPVSDDLLVELRRRLDDGLSDEQRNEIVRLLVRRVVVYTDLVDGKKRAWARVEYRFPAAVPTRTDTDSSRRRA